MLDVLIKIAEQGENELARVAAADKVKLEAAVFHERNIALCQFYFERTTVMGSSEQHRLLLQQNSRLAIFQHSIDHVPRLIRLITH